MVGTEREMVVYVELAFLENFLLDGLLLYLAVRCARLKPGYLWIAAAAAVGAAEAIVFPLLPLPVWAAYLLKGLGGALLVVIAVRGRRLRPYLIAGAAFFFLTFALGGLLTAVDSFFGVEYEEGRGFLVERAPVGLIFGGAGLFAVAVIQGAKALYRYRKVKRNLLSCTLRVGEKQVLWTGYADSGNNLFYRGNPVCVTSAAAIFALFGKKVKEEGRMTVGTVNGERTSPVFVCDRMEIRCERELITRENVYLTVGEVSPDYGLILNTALMEA